MEKVCNHSSTTRIRFLRAVRADDMVDDVYLLRCQGCSEEFEAAYTRSRSKPVLDLYLLNQHFKTWDSVEMFRNILNLPHPQEENPIGNLRRSKYWKTHLVPCGHIGRALVVSFMSGTGEEPVINGVFTLNDAGLSENYIKLLKEEKLL